MTEAQEKARKKWIKNNPEKNKEIKREWARRNKEKKGIYNKDWKKRNSEKVKEMDKRIREKYPNRIKARREANKIIISINQLCEKCNENLAVERHHEDYNKPLEIKFLCKGCHSELNLIQEVKNG